MPTRPCVCEGSNENCMYCGGRGFVGSSWAKPSSSTKRSGSSSSPSDNWDLNRLDERLVRSINPLSARPAAKGTAVRPVWEDLPHPPQGIPHPTRAVIPEPGLRKPEDLAGVLPLGVTIKHSSLSERNREVCRFCFRPVSFDGGADQHLAKWTAITGMSVHPDIASLNKLPQPRPAQRPKPVTRETLLESQPVRGAAGRSGDPDQFSYCPYCRVPVKNRNRSSHIERVHFGRKHFRSKYQDEGNRGASHKAKSGKVLPPGEVFREAFALANSLERRDKTRDYAHAFRENGRYGSHPIHDGFDDESGPE